MAPRRHLPSTVRYADINADHLRVAINRLDRLHRNATYAMPEDGFAIPLQFTSSDLRALGTVIRAAECYLMARSKKDPRGIPRRQEPLTYPSEFPSLSGEVIDANL